MDLDTFLKNYTISNIGGKLLGLDISSHAIIEAKKNNLSELIDYKVANILEFEEEFSEKFDLIFCSKTLYYLAPEIDLAMENIKKNGS